MNDIELALEDLDTLVEIARQHMTIGEWLGIVQSALVIKEALKKQLNGGWIPVSERLPTQEEVYKNDGRFIVTDGNRVYQSLFSIYDGKQFVDITYKGNCNFITTIDKCVTAWQNLPEQYKEKNNE